MFDNIHHLTGQRRFIRLILEKRVLRYSYFMIVEILGKKIQPCGLVICYEMNLVAVIGKRFSQLGGDNSAATKCRIAYNSYFHKNHNRFLTRLDRKSTRLNSSN